MDNNKPISRIEINSLGYSEFFNEFLVKNQPCIIYNTTKTWKAYSEWVDYNNKTPNFEFLARKYGNLEVPTVNCCKDIEKCTKKCITFDEYIKYWKECINKDSHEPVRYLKDWHLKRQRPEDEFYKVPEYFSSDWLNEYSLDKEIDDYMFVYMGPKGSWTPFHADVYRSFSWSANIIGKKRWLLFPPGEETKFMDSLGNLPSDIENVLSDNINFFEIFQHPGEAIFVPSGWYHQVFNVEHTISINHNWINRCNVNMVWNSLLENLNAVEDEIKEFNCTEGWHEHCQLMLRALFGMNFQDFINFISHICDKRIQSLKTGLSVAFNFTYYRKCHIWKDLKSLNEILNSIVSEIKNRNLNNIIDIYNIHRKIETINKYL